MRVVKSIVGVWVLASLIAPCSAEEVGADAAKGVAPAGSETPVTQPQATAQEVATPEMEGNVILPQEGLPADEKVIKALDAFCSKWMGFLAVRERDNRKAIHWQTEPDGVRGQFVGYSSDYKCQMKPLRSKKDTPVATIVYREYLYQQEGPSTAEAAETAPRVMEATEVTEIFRYSQGKWVY